MSSLLDVDVAQLPGGDLDGHLRGLGRLHRSVHAALVHAALAWLAARVPRLRRFGDLTAALVTEAGLSRAEALRVTAVARGVLAVPVGGPVLAALGEGRIGLAHAETILRADPALHADLAGLLAAAGERDAEGFADHVRDLEAELDAADPDPGAGPRRLRERRCAHESVRRDGMGEVRLVLTPEDYAAVRAAAHAVADAMFRRAHPDGHAEPDDEPFEALLADAYVQLIRVGVQPSSRSAGAGRGAGRARTTAEVLVTVPLETLVSGVGTAHLQGYGLVPAAMAQRLACGEHWRLAVLGLDGEVLALGRSHRTATRAQRIALTARDGPTCASAGCTVSWEQCQAHHIRPWDHDGPTDLDNLVHLCSRHHHQVHDHGMVLHRDPDGTWRLIPPPAAETSEHRHARGTPRRHVRGRHDRRPTSTPLRT